MEKKQIKELTGAELASMLKSNIQFKSLGGVRSDDLILSADKKKWWRDAKIGLFIHWGLYSILGRGEWVRFNEKIPKETYEALADTWKPQEFETKEWVKLAKDMGARYMVMVARHHDGFSLWKSEGSYEQFTSWHRGAHRDYVKEYVDACREAGMRIGIYYSTMDWRFPGYFDPKGMPDNAALMKKQCYDQVKELCSQYGTIDILWYDGSWLAHEGSDTSSAWFWEPVKLNRMARSYNPDLLINPRSGWEGDFYCDEGSHEIKGNVIPVPWEKNMCLCSGKSWGWIPDDPVSDFDWLIRMMVNVVCRGGNWLLNIGPDSNGKVSLKVKMRLQQIGNWLKKYGDSIYGTRGGPWQPVDDVYGSTWKNNTVYLHILDREAFEKEALPKLDNDILEAKLFNGTKITMEEEERGIRFILPDDGTKEPDTIIIVTMRDPIRGIEEEDIRFVKKE